MFLLMLFIYGNPADVYRFRFSEKDIEVLLEIQWWDWTVEMIRKAGTIIQSNNVSELKKFFEVNIKGVKG